MKTDKESIEKAKALLSELAKLENALDVLNNYDATAYMYFYTQHNNNKQFSSNDAKIPMPASMKKEAISHINQRVTEIKQELEKI